ncbi:nitrite reductase large subunit NirB [Armatimonas sp.]|uniref:nitrite reductase large subunit NirB n=1 Tax=Armatimonas sp. TaxID=1872638 RepID=UPI0037520A21
MKEKLVVIGNGMAGARTVEEILARGGGERFEITMIGDEPYGNYNRILLSNVLNGAQEANEIFLNPLAWYTDNGVELIAGVRAAAIDRESRSVALADGQSIAYDQLIIATGSRPFVPRMEGLYTEEADSVMRSGVFVFRTIDDCSKIAGTAAKARKAAVIGGGLLGLEAARGLLRFGCEVHVIHLSTSLMENQLDATAGRILKATMQKMGVHVHLEKATTSILGDSEVTGLAFKDGTTLDCDMVVISCGITPNTEIAKACGLSVERGIVVTDAMQSVDDEKIWVVGECAQHRGRVYGLVAPLWDQGVVLADRLTARKPEAVYGGSKLATKLKVMGVELASMGVTGAQEDDDEEIVYSEPKTGIYKKLIIRNGQLIGAILLGDADRAGYLIQNFDRGNALPDERALMLFDIGEAPALGATMIEMPEAAQVCNCNGVTKGAIVKCVGNGARSLKMVMEQTRAGTGCGSCKKLVGEIVDWACDGQTEEDPSVHYYVPGVPLKKTELVEAIKAQSLKSVSAVFNALAEGREDAGSKMGLASLLRSLWGAQYEDERDARYINDRVHANIQKDRTFSVIPRIYGGITTADDLIKIGQVAKKYDVPMVKFTGGQRIDLLGIKKEDLPGVWQDLGMPSGHAYAKAFRTVKTCVGTDFCRYGLGDSTTLGITLEKRYQGLETPGKVKMATAGCPRNCSEAYVKDVGYVAIGDGKWEIYIGGAAGAHIRKGDLLAVVGSHEAAITLTDRFLQYYIENARYLERTYGFVERLGIAPLRALLVDDSEGLALQLEAALKIQLDAYVDPWEEALVNKNPNQFRSELRVVNA